jgi:hypothetical protein
MSLRLPSFQAVLAAIAVSCVVVLLAGAAYQAAYALQWLAEPTEPGDDPTAGGYLLLAGFLVMLLGASMTYALAAARDAPHMLASLLAPAAAAFVLARHYTFDAYYAPTLRRIADNGVVPEWLVFGLVGASVFAALVTVRLPSVGCVLAATLLCVCACTVLLQAGGH